jgi:hypothetical protein
LRQAEVDERYDDSAEIAHITATLNAVPPHVKKEGQGVEYPAEETPSAHKAAEIVARMARDAANELTEMYHVTMVMINDEIYSQDNNRRIAELDRRFKELREICRAGIANIKGTISLQEGGASDRSRIMK